VLITAYRATPLEKCSKALRAWRRTFSIGALRVIKYLQTLSSAATCFQSPQRQSETRPAGGERYRSVKASSSPGAARRTEVVSFLLGDSHLLIRRSGARIYHFPRLAGKVPALKSARKEALWKSIFSREVDASKGSALGEAEQV